MNILRRLARAFRNSEIQDIAPIRVDTLKLSRSSADWRKRKLAEAAEKYGKPFKCAGEHLPREIILRDRIVERHGELTLSRATED